MNYGYHYGSQRGGIDPKALLTPGVLKIIILNFICFLLYLMFPRFTEEFLFLMPYEVLERFFVWQLLSYMVLHASAWHLVGNMLMLFFIGSHVERNLGTKKFLWFFFLVGIISGLVYSLVGGLLFFLFKTAAFYEIPVVGSSGAVFGVVTVFCMMFWNEILLLWGIIPIKGKWLFYFFLGLSIIGTLSQLRGLENIAHFAHLLGMVLAYVYYGNPKDDWKNFLRRKKRKKAKSVFEDEFFHLHND